ncbi:hypothetical protein [Azospirillum thermophilum]|uniref:Uncharacterized protein n=1 Tax=Azospirillum thermophilum TaxID=2202148 RepID=A0A2S2CPC3_9PROT|nr:hypothetical protein [Azospirillum thermophilum]AWK86351.1 hypothetical protein DEW08_08955 [Azospirillum thermophilum]
MDDRRMPTPKSPFTEALKSDPKENAEKARRLYDSPDRQSVTDANRRIPDDSREPPADPGSAANVRRPL